VGANASASAPGFIEAIGSAPTAQRRIPSPTP
jgi:hypothetical protein